MVARGEDPLGLAPCPSLAGARHQDPPGTAMTWLARDEQAQRELSISLPDAVTPLHPASVRRTNRKSLLALRGVGPESEAESVRFHGRRVTKVGPVVKSCRRKAGGR